MDLAPYAGAIEKVSDLASGVVKRIWPEKMSELDAARMKQEITMALLTQQGAEVMKEFDDRADARSLAAKDVEKGNWFTNVLAATVRPIFAFACMGAFLVPLVLRIAHLALGHTVPEFTLNAIEKEVVLSVIYFYFGGRVVEKGMAVWKGNNNGHKS